MKKGFTLIELLAVIIILAIIALITFPIVDNSIKNSKQAALERTIGSIEEAAHNYSSQNNLGYPEEEKAISLDELKSSGFLTSDITNPVTNEEMTGCVLYRWDEAHNQYVFRYDEECKVNEEKPNLTSTLLEQVGSKGLVQDSTNSNIYYYEGGNDVVTNNYLWYGGHHWRIVEIDTNANTLLLVSQQPLTTISSSDKVWKTQDEYESSYINNWLNDYFYNSLDKDVQNNIVESTFNVGIYTDVDEITTSQKVGLLDINQYTRAGERNSYLDIKINWWLGNRQDNSYFYRVTDLGSPYHSSKTSTISVRPVIKIYDVTITGGNGTLKSNYETGVKSTSTSNIQVGEYINVPYSGTDNACGSDNKCTFRVVSKDSDSIKVILNGLLPKKSQYGDNIIISTNHIIYTSLNSFSNNISTNYRYTGNKMFYIGDYPGGTDYTSIQDEKLEANVGLPTIGEMFSGNDIDFGDGLTNDLFVNDLTVENRKASNYYWLMNRKNSSSVCNIYDIGSTNSYPATSSFGVRPVIFLKNNLNFTGGKGTAESPYELQ